MGKGQDVVDINVLMDAFETFKETSTKLEVSYKELEERTVGLDTELAEKNNFLSAVLESLPVGLIATDEGGRINTVNNEICSILGKKASELTGASLSESLLVIDKCGEGDCEVTVRTVDKAVKTLTVTQKVLRSVSGEEAGRLIVVKDISEITRLRRSDQREKRLAAMGVMAASIAHQIKNPLGSIELFASVLRDELKGEEENRKYAVEIVRAVRILNNTLSNMLLFANTSRLSVEQISLEELSEEIRSTCGFIAAEKGVTLSTEGFTSEAPIKVDAELMKQAIINLIMNALDAVSDRPGGEVSLYSRKTKDFLEILVSDNGAGIPEEDIDKVFDPFFTTRPKGTGLGLAVVSSIVKSHGGEVDVSSDSNGTTFTVSLPSGAKTEVLVE